MATYNVYTYSALVIISCLVSISVHVHGTCGSSTCLNTISKDPKMVVARDIITLSVREVQEMRKFVNAIPRLKSLQRTDTSEMLGCVGGLIANLSEMKAILVRIRHLKGPYLSVDAHSLRNKMDNTLNLSKTCTQSMKDVDNIFVAMFSRKIVDLALIVDDVLYRVSRLEPNIPRAEVARNS